MLSIPSVATSTHHRTILFTSTLVPGALTLGAGAFLAVPPSERDSFQQSLTHVASLTQEASAMTVVVGAILLLILSFALGLTIRSLTFGVFRFALGGPPPPKELRNELIKILGSHVDEVRKQYTPLWSILDPKASNEATTPDGLRKQSRAVHEFSRNWLRMIAPVMAIDDYEFEINMAWTLLLPTSLLAIVIMRWVPDDPSAAAVVGPAAALIVVWGALARLGIRSSRSEPIAAVRNLLFAHWIINEAPRGISADASPSSNREPPQP